MNMNVFQRSRAFFHGVRRDVHVPTKSRGCLNSILALASAKRIKLSMCRAVIGAPPGVRARALTGRLTHAGPNFHK